MSPLDRLAWRCSWIAPVAWAAALGLFILSMLAARSDWESGAHGWRTLGPVAVLIALGVAVLAHMIVHYHAVKAGSFRNIGMSERNKLEVALHFGMKYARWRDRMRAEHPELRRRGSRSLRASGRDADAG